MKQLAELEKSLLEEIERHPDYPDLANMLGLLLSLRGRHPEALEQFDRALTINPGYEECKTNRAFALAHLDKTDEAVQTAAELAQASQNYDLLVACGKLLAWLHDPAGARAALEHARELKPNCPAVHHYIGLTLLDEDLHRAADCFEKAASLGSAFIALYDSLHIYKNGRVKLSKEAARSLSKQLAQNPYLIKVFLSAATTLASEQRFDEASEQMEKARAIEPDSPAIENSLGLIAIAREYAQEASAHFRRALQFDPANVNAHVNLAFQLGAEGELEEAEKEIRSAVELEPQYADLRLQLATILAERAGFDEAVVHLRHALSINPEYIFAIFVTASILFARKQYQEVIETYARIDVDSTGLPEVYSHLATSYLEVGDAEQAYKVAIKAVSKEDAMPASYVCAAIACHRLGKHGEALATAQQYIEKFPDGPEIEEIKRLRDLLQKTPQQ